MSRPAIDLVNTDLIAARGTSYSLTLLNIPAGDLV